MVTTELLVTLTFEGNYENIHYDPHGSNEDPQGNYVKGENLHHDHLCFKRK